MDNKEKYLSVFDNIGVSEGEILLVSSDITRLCVNYNKLYKEHLSLDDIINKLQQIVGPTGTILFPTFNWDFCKGKKFDYRKTPCRTGALGTAALKRPDFSRTLHPIYSFAVWGKGANELCQLTNISSFGVDSPFGWLDNNRAKQLVIDVPKQTTNNGLGFTFSHYVEQCSGVVKYRYDKPFTAEYVDADGVVSVRTYSMFVRDLNLDVANDFAELHQELIDRGVEKHYCFEGLDYYLIDLHSSVPIIMNDIINNKSRKFCIYKGQ